MSDPTLLGDKIRALLGPCRLGEWPTPLEPAPALGHALGVAALALKREDRSSPRYGGNKVRGLEFLLAGAPAGTVFVTVGGTGSTHCLATAVHAPTLGCRTVLAQFPQPDTATGRAVARSSAARATLVVCAAGPMTLPFALLAAWRGARRLGPRRWIPAGGAHPRGVLGQLLAGLELAAQVAEPPDAVVLPLGTGGTAAGVALAVAALGWPTRVVAVRVAARIVANRGRALRLAERTRRLLGRHEIRVPSAGPLDVVDGSGAGYGHPSPDGEAARELAASHGLALDPTYGAKAFAFLLRVPARLRRIVFWHTFAAPPALPEPAA